MFRIKNLFLFIALSSLTVVLTACATNNTSENLNQEFLSEFEYFSQENIAEISELVVYSSRNENFVNQLLEKFENETGIKVSALHAGETIVNKIKEEENNVQADIMISNDVGALEFLRLEGLLKSHNPKGVESISDNFRAIDNSWFALSARTRVLMYNKDLISEGEMPKNIWQLTDPQFKDSFAITRGGNGGMIGHVSALRNEWGDEKTLQWLSLIKDNAAAITQGHGDIRRAVGSGEFKFGLVNNYYYHQQLREPSNNNVGVIYPDQGDDDMGAVVNAAGVGIIKNSPNPLSAKIFLEWILLPQNQQEFSYKSLEVPINPEIEAISEAAKITDYRVHSMPLNQLGSVWLDTRELIESSGLDLEIR